VPWLPQRWNRRRGGRRGTGRVQQGRAMMCPGPLKPAMLLLGIGINVPKTTSQGRRQPLADLVEQLHPAKIRRAGVILRGDRT
jgi:hypothetical protein